MSGNLTCYIEGSKHLAAFDQEVTQVVPVITAGLPSPSVNWNYRSFRLPGAIGGATPRGPAGFLRATVGELPE